MASLLDVRVRRSAATEHRVRVVHWAARVAWSLCMLTLVVAAPRLSAAAATSPAVPAWVKPGLVLQYVEDLGGYMDYDYRDTVVAVSQGRVHVQTYSWSPGLSGTGKTVATSYRG